MEEVTYMIKVKVEKSADYEELEQALYDVGANDVELMEKYDD